MQVMIINQAHYMVLQSTYQHLDSFKSFIVNLTESPMNHSIRARKFWMKYDLKNRNLVNKRNLMIKLHTVSSIILYNTRYNKKSQLESVRI